MRSHAENENVYPYRGVPDLNVFHSSVCHGCTFPARWMEQADCSVMTAGNLESITSAPIRISGTILTGKLYRAKMEQMGLPADQIERNMEESAGPMPLSPPTMPAKGNVTTLVILVDFPKNASARHFADQTTADVQSKMFGNGNSGDVPYESLRNYYMRSSYNNLTITGDVKGWYGASHDRPYYASYKNATTGENGMDILLVEALEYYKNQIDLSQYDLDNDGAVDGIYLIYAGPTETGIYWAWTTDFHNSSFSMNGKKIRSYVFEFYTISGGIIRSLQRRQSMKQDTCSGFRIIMIKMGT